jgi:sulfate adenylyltransferase
VAFQPGNLLHRADQEMTKRAIQQTDGTLLLQPVVGVTKPGDIDHYTRVRSYKVLSDRYHDPARTLLALLPLATRMAGPREAVWHAIIHRNFGANHVLVGPDYASADRDSVSQSFYEPYTARQLLDQYSREVAVKPIIFSEFLYVPEEDRYEEATRLRPGGNLRAISVTEIRNHLQSGRPLPEWIMQPDLASILNRSYPPQDQQGFCVWFTGLSGSGKSTTARIVTAMLMEHGRRVTVLDGDVVRTQLSKGLGFGKEDRDTNIRRIGFVAAEIVRHGGAVVCAAVSPYRSTRNECRSIVGYDRFIEVFVNTPLEACALRDKKGMYALAREGKIKGFTGIDDPYEMPVGPEVEIETLSTSAEENAKRILQYVFERGFLLRDGSDSQ